MADRFRSVLLLARLVLLPALAGLAASSPPPSAQPPTLSADDAGVLTAALRDAEAQGLAVPAFDPADPAQVRSATLAYARAQRGGRLSPGQFPNDWAIRPGRYDPAQDLAQAVAERRLQDWVAGLPPPDPRYAALVGAYGRYRTLASRGGWPSLVAGGPLKPGEKGARVEALARRLAIEDPSAGAPAPSAEPVYDQVLAKSVARAQARYGLTADGVAGAATLKALNVPVEARLGQIRANLERWRWVQRTLPTYRVELNTADASLQLFDGAGPGLAMRAIVGRPSKPTPMFQDEIEAIVLNPPWNVPPEIAAKEIWPKIRRDPGYMAREGFVVRPGGGLQQRPGPKCALGSIKFDLPNRFGVYLHDTPSRSLFARDSRALSHGCMRLEKPNVLAERLLKDSPDWPPWRVQAILAAGTTQRIMLPRHVPVFVFYRTAFTGDDGQVNFRQDVYHWDERLLALLAAS
jgi:murein L,D-transpeptidase YcbB/YkuD